MTSIGNSDYARIAAALGYLVNHAGPPPTLEETARHVGLSEFHFQRLFHRWVGVTPKTVLQLMNLQAARGLVVREPALGATSARLGLSSPGRLHDLFIRFEAMTPGAYKAKAAGVTIRWGVLPLLLGPACIATTELGLCGVHFVSGPPELHDDEALAHLKGRWPGAAFVADQETVTPVAAAIDARLQGQPPTPLSVLLKGTAFQVKVWEALLRLPEGYTLPYGQLARELGAPGASRAVGSAVAANPLAVLIPCHRVIRQSGVIGEYRWGTGRKRLLLALESGRRLDEARTA